MCLKDEGKMKFRGYLYLGRHTRERSVPNSPIVTQVNRIMNGMCCDTEYRVCGRASNTSFVFVSRIHEGPATKVNSFP